MENFEKTMRTDLGRDKFLNSGLELLGSALKFAEVDVFESAYDDLDVVEDDGNLHISAYQKRYCVGIGQDVNMREYRAEANRALKALRVTGYKVTGS